MPDLPSSSQKANKADPPRRRKWRLPAILTFLFLAIAVCATPPKLPAIEPSPDGYGIPTQRYSRADLVGRLPELRARFGKNKMIPPLYELEILLALSHYPSLGDAHIRFVLTEDRVPISSRPYIWPMFRRKKNWLYMITISEGSTLGGSPAYIKNMSFNSRVGGIGHELGHTAFYIQKSLPQMAWVGFCFLFRKYQIQFERDTDVRATHHGLGWQLYAWSVEIRGGRTNTRPDSWLDTFYLSPEQIEAEMRLQQEYQPFFQD